MNWADSYLNMKHALNRFALHAEIGEWDRAQTSWEDVQRWRDELDLAIRVAVLAVPIRERAERPATGSCGDAPALGDE